MLDWRLPMPIEASFRYLGGMTTPLAMLFIGIAISKASWSEIKFDRELTAAMVGRFVICPLCVMVCLPFCAAEIDERCICYAGGYAGDDEHFYCS